MIHKDGFSKGDVVEFQNSNHCWTRGTVQAVEWPEVRVEGPGGQIVEKQPARIHVLVADSVKRKLRIVVLPKKRVRAVNGG